jgi:hypothetical protein
MAVAVVAVWAAVAAPVTVVNQALAGQALPVVFLATQLLVAVQVGRKAFLWAMQVPVAAPVTAVRARQIQAVVVRAMVERQAFILQVALVLFILSQIFGRWQRQETQQKPLCLVVFFTSLLALELLNFKG